MKYLEAVVIAFFAVSEVYAASLECPSICPAVFQPTCATNGKEYLKFDNLCGLKAFNCDRQRLALAPYTATEIDWCTTSNLDGVEINLKPGLDADNQSCNGPCPMIYRPVCGSNGTYRKTFANECVMNSFGCFFKKQYQNNWKVLHRAKCSHPSQHE